VARREFGDVYVYDYGDTAGPRPMVIVAPYRGGNNTLGVEVTNTPFNAPYVVPVASLATANLTGFIRCDRIVTVNHDDRYFRAYICSLGAADMAIIATGLKAALAI